MSLENEFHYYYWERTEYHLTLPPRVFHWPARQSDFDFESGSHSRPTHNSRLLPDQVPEHWRLRMSRPCYYCTLINDLETEVFLSPPDRDRDHHRSNTLGRRPNNVNRRIKACLGRWPRNRLWMKKLSLLSLFLIHYNAFEWSEKMSNNIRLSKILKLIF